MLEKNHIGFLENKRNNSNIGNSNEMSQHLKFDKSKPNQEYNWKCATFDPRRMLLVEARVGIVLICRKLYLTYSQRPSENRWHFYETVKIEYVLSLDLSVFPYCWSLTSTETCEMRRHELGEKKWQIQHEQREFPLINWHFRSHECPGACWLVYLVEKWLIWMMCAVHLSTIFLSVS